MQHAYRGRLRSLADEAGLPFDPPDHVPRAIEALEAAEWVRKNHRKHFPEVHRALFQGYWSEGRDIGARDVIVEVAGAAGVPADDLERALEAREAHDAVERSTSTAVQLGVNGTPAWLFEQRVMVPGAQPRDVFDRVVETIREEADEPAPND